MVEEKGKQVEGGQDARKPWTRRELGGKEVWDWLQLLIVPLALVVIGYLFTAQQDARQQRTENQRAEAERELAVQRAQDEALQAYLDQMTNLLLEKNLRESKKDSEVRLLAQARTATVMQRLDADGNRNLISFLKEAKLIGDLYGEHPDAISLLAGTDLTGARLEGLDLDNVDLYGTTLNNANLSGALAVWMPNASLVRADMSRIYLEDSNLVGAVLDDAILRDARLIGANLLDASLKHADLSGAYIGQGTLLRHAVLTGADLTGANLRGADLSGALLNNANLGGASLRDADLSGADLTNAKVTEEQLQEAESLKGATMPNGQKYEDWIKDK